MNCIPSKDISNFCFIEMSIYFHLYMSFENTRMDSGELHLLHIICIIKSYMHRFVVGFWLCPSV